MTIQQKIDEYAEEHSESFEDAALDMIRSGIIDDWELIDLPDHLFSRALYDLAREAREEYLSQEMDFRMDLVDMERNGR